MKTRRFVEVDGFPMGNVNCVFHENKGSESHIVWGQIEVSFAEFQGVVEEWIERGKLPPVVPVVFGYNNHERN